MGGRAVLFRRVMVGGALMVIAVACALVVSHAVAQADTAPISPTQDLPWTDPAHQSPLEVLAGQIASKIAGRQVGVRCEGETDWKTLTSQRDFDEASLLGYVGTSVSSGRLVTEPFAQIAPGMCWYLQQFAMANPKPTLCTTTVTQTSTSYVSKRVAVKTRVVVKGKTQMKTVWQIRSVPVTTSSKQPGDPAPCPTLDSARVTADYAHYAQAILTLTHESVHLGGAISGVFRTGQAFGEIEAEAKANCYGIQWMWWAATQLGASPQDAQALATWTYQVIYPGYRNAAGVSRYWSADCVPNGRLDIRADKTAAWPVGGAPLTVTGAPSLSLPASSLIDSCWVTDKDSWEPADQLSRTTLKGPNLTFVTKLKSAAASDSTATGTVTSPLGTTAYTTSWAWKSGAPSWRFGVVWTNAARGNYTFKISLSDGSACEYTVAFTN